MAAMADSAACARSIRAISFSTTAGVRAFSRGLHPIEDRALQRFLVGREGGNVGVRRIGLRYQVEEVERPSRRPGQIGGDSRDDAAGRAGDGEDGVRGELDAHQLGVEPDIFERDSPPSTFVMANLDRARIRERFVHEQRGHSRRVRVRREVDRLHQHCRRCSRWNAFVKPVTAPPMGAAAPAAS